MSPDDEREFRRLLNAVSPEKLLREAMRLIGRPRWEIKAQIERYGRGVVVDSILYRAKRDALVQMELKARLRKAEKPGLPTP